jgi:hypothetical protein
MWSFPPADLAKARDKNEKVNMYKNIVSSLYCHLMFKAHSITIFEKKAFKLSKIQL